MKNSAIEGKKRVKILSIDKKSINVVYRGRNVNFSFNDLLAGTDLKNGIVVLKWGAARREGFLDA